MERIVKESVTIEGARIGFLNLSGAPGKYNEEGDRNFVVFLEENLARQMEDDGWNVRWRRFGDAEEETATLKVSVKFGRYPPRIFMISGGRKTPLDEISVGSIDYADIENVDLIIRPYNWEARGNRGVKAYLKTMYVTVYDDDLDRKYAGLADSFGAPSTDEDIPF